MGKYSKCKLIISGDVLEFYEYEKPVQLEHEGRSGGRRKDGEERSEKSDTIRKSTLRKARNDFRRLALSNFSNRDKFLTLTFRDTDKINIRDIEDCNKEFKKFIQRMKYEYGDFKYMAVIEFQDKNRNGAIHYHILCNLPYIPIDNIASTWRNGFVGINSIEGCDNIGAYMTKYMMKKEDDRLRGKKSYFTSRNLEKPQVIQGWKAERLLEEYKTQKKKVSFSNGYESEHLGQINYYEYNIKRMRKDNHNK